MFLNISVGKGNSFLQATIKTEKTELNRIKF